MRFALPRQVSCFVLECHLLAIVPCNINNDESSQLSENDSTSVENQIA